MLGLIFTKVEGSLYPVLRVIIKIMLFSILCKEKLHWFNG